MPPASTTAAKRKRILEYVTTTLDAIDPSGTNTKRFTARFDAMSDQEVERFIRRVENGEENLRVEMPNLKLQFDMDGMLELGRKRQTGLFEQLWIRDVSTGRRYLTPIAYPILQLPVRRPQQTVEHSLSTQEDDRTIDALSGQKVGRDKAVGLSNPEIQVLYSRGLTKTLNEMVAIRGGNVAAYSEFRSQLESAGMVTLAELDPSTRTRASVVLHQQLLAMHLDNNLLET